jgi:hypothetical protein
VLSPLEDGEMQSATSLKEDMKVASPLEASVKVKVFDSKMWKHLIPARIAIIPIVVSMTKKEAINPFGGVLGHAFRNILIPDNRFKVSHGCNVMVLEMMSAVMPSSNDAPPSVLGILDGCIW